MIIIISFVKHHNVRKLQWHRQTGIIMLAMRKSDRIGKSSILT